MFALPEKFTQLEIWLAGILVATLAVIAYGFYERYEGAKNCRAEVKESRAVAIAANKLATEKGNLAASRVDAKYAADLAAPITIAPRILVPTPILRAESAGSMPATATVQRDECAAANLRNENQASDLQGRLDTLGRSVVQIGHAADAEVIYWRDRLRVAETVCATRAS